MISKVDLKRLRVSCEKMMRSPKKSKVLRHDEIKAVGEVVLSLIDQIERQDRLIQRYRHVLGDSVDM